MKKLSTAIIFTLMAFFATTVPTLATANQSYTCDSAAQVIRNYKGNPQAWKNRGLYTEPNKATLYFEANCTGGGTNSIVNAGTKGATIRAATCKDCYNAGYRKGVQAGQLAERRRGPVASSVTTPPTYRKVANVSHQPVRTVYVSQPKVQMIAHGNHSHHSEAEKLDCALTDALNRRAGPVTSFVKRTITPATFSKVRTASKVPMISHGDHSHHTAVEKADCELTDALNRRAGSVVTVVRRTH
ncbi:hypothetical protein [Leucothrix arctica]|uniref:Uncharacterized protein n=1 Tax=Leucothrix arctica TaxID=1481894 RepID=A0A317CCS7_9GAMM|nr:hypothetical protein [Leucothrix arctica]PWQ94110.1 hypothetical protein DKT75_16350 [Leucothrix arctica]